ncbi:MAG: outer membrane beta-barrel protein [Saprospiraceae bacterium]|nr:outer membrane beta-barrel protein [Saprospiraceae bacterium]
MKNFTFCILILAFSLFICNKNSAQYTEVGVGLGFSTYWGDLNGQSFSKNVIKNSGLAIQLSARKIIKKYIGVKGSFSYGSMKGDDANSSRDWQKLRNLNFKSSIMELALTGEFYLFGYDTEPGSSVFSPYLTAGIAAFRFDPKTIYQGNEVRLQPLGTEGQGMTGFKNKYSLYSFSIPFGAGAKFLISDKVNVSIDVIIRRAFTDYLDDVSSKYVNYDDLNAGNGTLAANLGNRMNEYLGQSEPVQLQTGTQRGGAIVNDYYIMSFVSMNIMLNDGSRNFGSGKIICPKF